MLAVVGVVSSKGTRFIIVLLWASRPRYEKPTQEGSKQEVVIVFSLD
jgi:hypothetical protein